ncbi:hypothetical protein ACWN8P_13080 [Vagococcus salmoninarum]|uniref:Uncharacterized protein n=1 Tax=Vagococcus salmoninarum TaxID=2739 RepID=A0A429ZDG1_9ENTE|nr:hypothetical protein [Vagococcus salmoninarum]RST91719.1 hypothetical protein CBF35_13855 [Vagococcus salmoninarum]
MEIIEGLFDGQGVILKDKTHVLLKEIWRGRLELRPYLLFPVKSELADGELTDTETGILYPHTVDRELDKSQLVYGEKRPTRILHLIPFGGRKIIRKPDLRNPHSVKILGFRRLILEKLDGTEIQVDIDGNCYELPEGVDSLVNGREEQPLAPFYDRPSDLANIIKKAGIEVYSK